MLDAKPPVGRKRRRLLMEVEGDPQGDDPRTAYAEEKTRERQERIHDLIEALGGHGTVHVKKWEGGNCVYKGMVTIDQIAEGPEQVIIDEWGGGRFLVEFREKSKVVGSVTIYLDPRLKSREERERAQAPQTQALPTADAFQTMIRDTVKGLLAELLPRRDDGEKMYLEMLKMQRDSSDRLLAIQERAQDRMLEVVRAGSQPAPQANLLEQVSTVARVVEAVEGIRGPVQPAPSSKAEMVMGMLQKPLERVADRIVDKALGGGGVAVPLPAPATPPVHLEKRTPGTPLPGSKSYVPLSKEKLREMRDQARDRQKNGAPPPPPPAPAVREIAPAAPTEKAAAG